MCNPYFAIICLQIKQPVVELKIERGVQIVIPMKIKYNHLSGI